MKSYKLHLLSFINCKCLDMGFNCIFDAQSGRQIYVYLLQYIPTVYIYNRGSWPSVVVWWHGSENVLISTVYNWTNLINCINQSYSDRVAHLGPSLSLIKQHSFVCQASDTINNSVWGLFNVDLEREPCTRGQCPTQGDWPHTQQHEVWRSHNRQQYRALELSM